MIFTGYKNSRLNITRSVAETVIDLTGKRGLFHLDDVVFAVDLQIKMAKDQGLFSRNGYSEDIVITRQQVQGALSAIVHKACASKFLPIGLKSTGHGWYEWEKQKQ